MPSTIEDALKKLREGQAPGRGGSDIDSALADIRSGKFVSPAPVTQEPITPASEPSGGFLNFLKPTVQAGESMVQNVGDKMGQALQAIRSKVPGVGSKAWDFMTATRVGAPEAPLATAYDPNASPADRFLIGRPAEAAPVVREYMSDFIAGKVDSVPQTRENILKKAELTGKVPYVDIANRTLAEMVSEGIPLTPTEVALTAAIPKAINYTARELATAFPVLSRSMGEIGSALKEWATTRKAKVPISAEEIKSFYVFGREKLDPKTYDILVKMDPEAVKEMAKAGQGIEAEMRVPRFSKGPSIAVASEPAEAGGPLATVAEPPRGQSPLAPAAPIPPASAPATLPDENTLRAMVEKAGGEWRGIQKTSRPGAKGLAFFNDPQTHSTLSVPIEQMSPEAVAQRIQASRAEMSEPAAPSPAAKPQVSIGDALQQIRQAAVEGPKRVTEAKDFLPGTPAAELPRAGLAKGGEQVPTEDLLRGMESNKPRQMDISEVGKEPGIPEEEVRTVARHLFEQALEERRTSVSGIEKFVQENGGIGPYKKGQAGIKEEAVEYRTAVPLHLRGSTPYDEMLDMLKEANLLPKDAAYGSLYSALERIPRRGATPKVSDFVEEARRMIEQERLEAPLTADEEARFLAQRESMEPASAYFERPPSGSVYHERPLPTTRAPQPPNIPPEVAAKPGASDTPPAIELPEIVELSKELMMGKYPEIRQALSKGAFGQFSARTGKIALSAGIFKDPQQAASTLAHEVGHLTDWLPDKEMHRGNILGRIATLKDYLKSMIEAVPESTRDLPLAPGEAEGVITEGERRRFKNNATVTVLKQEGKRLGDYIKDPKVRAMLKDKINAKYQEIIGRTIKERGLITKKEIMEELKKVSKMWKPFDEAADPAYTHYRHNPPELYADAISVLFNKPALLREVAPNFYKAWFDYLGRKPEVQTAYNAVVNKIRGGKVLEGREAGVEEMFTEGELVAKKERTTEDSMTLRKFLDTVHYEFLDKDAGMISAVARARVKTAPDQDPVLALEEMNYSGSEAKAWLMEYQTIMDSLEKAGIPWRRMGHVLFHERVIGERGALANPRGFTPETSAKQLEYARKSLGEGKWKVLREQVAKFRENWSYIVKKLDESGMLSPELMQKIRTNHDYATFDVFRKHMDTMAGGPAIGAKIYGQIGTLQDISNPATATVMKGVQLIRAVNKNEAVKKSAAFLKEHLPESIESAKTQWNGKTHAPVEPADPNKGLIIEMVNGKPQAYYVDGFIAKVFEKDARFNNLLVKGFQLANVYWRNVFVQRNPGFMPFNMIRDFMRAAKNIPSVGLAKAVPLLDAVKMAAYYLRSLAPSFRRGYDMPDPLIKEMLQKKILITVESKWGLTDTDEQMEALMARYFEGQGHNVPTLFKPFVALWDYMGAIGSAVEVMPKVAGYKYLKKHQARLGLADQEIAHMIRTQIGSPDFLRRGGAYPVYNTMFLFSNAIKEGWRGDLEVFRKRPGEYSWKTFQYGVFPKLLMYGALLGMAGEGTRRVMKKVPSYDLLNYITVPLGLDKNDKAVYLRIPMNETDRILSGLMMFGLLGDRGKDQRALFDYMAGQAPTLTPTLSILNDIRQYLAGKNPYDSFRGKLAIPDLLMQAMDTRTHAAFLKYLANEAGSGIIHRFDTDTLDKTKTKLEKVLGFPLVNNIIGRFLKVSNYGEFEELKAVSNEVRQEKARDYLDKRDAIVASVNSIDKPTQVDAMRLYGKMVKEGGLRKGTRIMSPGEFVKEYMRYVEKKAGDPRINALVFSTSNEEKAAILRHLKGTLASEEYKAVLKQALAEGHITQNALVQASQKPKAPVEVNNGR
jgi:hypothetical protein